MEPPTISQNIVLFSNVHGTDWAYVKKLRAVSVHTAFPRPFGSVRNIQSPSCPQPIALSGAPDLCGV